jgi:hypothetical protein
MNIAKKLENTDVRLKVFNETGISLDILWRLSRGLINIDNKIKAKIEECLVGELK